MIIVLLLVLIMKETLSNYKLSLLLLGEAHEMGTIGKKWSFNTFPGQLLLC